MRRTFCERIRISVPKFKYYRCSCGNEVVPVANPSKCLHCGRITLIME